MCVGVSALGGCVMTRSVICPRFCRRPFPPPPDTNGASLHTPNIHQFGMPATTNHCMARRKSKCDRSGPSRVACKAHHHGRSLRALFLPLCRSFAEKYIQQIRRTVLARTHEDFGSARVFPNDIIPGVLQLTLHQSMSAQPTGTADNRFLFGETLQVCFTVRRVFLSPTEK